METVCLIKSSGSPLEGTTSVRQSLLSTSNVTEASNSPSPVSPPKFGHQRNLSLDFRSMGIILPPLSATILSHK